MEIEIKKSFELLDSEWIDYTIGFNEVFEKEFTVEIFKHKYLNTIEGFSYHALLKSDNIVVGGFTVIPYEYIVEHLNIKIGVIVDVFIREANRTDLLALSKMFKKIKQVLVLDSIPIIITNPNDTAYPYWKKLVRMNEVGNLYFYALPNKLGNVLKKGRFLLNPLSFLGVRFLLLASNFIYTKEKFLPIRLNRANSEVIEKQRYSNKHKIISNERYFFSYRITDENNIKTCYLIDFYDKKKLKKDSNVLKRSVKYIIKNEDVDIILFVGKITFFQSLLFKVPQKLEPRHLHFMVEVASNEKVGPEIMNNFDNWDFGLFNFDVR